MDDLSRLSQSLGSNTDPAAALTALTGAVQDEGGLDALVEKLRAAGLDATVDSWISVGPNQVVQTNQLRAALGDDEVQRLSAGSGIDVTALLPLLATFLPQIINMLTPDGTVPSGGLNSAAQQQLPDLGGLLGGLLGGAGDTAGGTSVDELLGGLGGMLGGSPKS